MREVAMMESFIILPKDTSTTNHRHRFCRAGKYRPNIYPTGRSIRHLVPASKNGTPGMNEPDFHRDDRIEGNVRAG